MTAPGQGVVAPGGGVMDPLEEAFGIPIGLQRGVDPLGATAASPGQALLSVLAGALARPPCLVAFSGGRDSSLLLAAAVGLARSSGLAPPVAVTAVFPGSVQAEESWWQERMVRHLGVGDWERVELSDDLDLIGGYARRVLGCYGNLWPFNVHFCAPLIERARGGTLITGSGGDEVFGVHRFARPARWSLPDASLARRVGGHAARLAPRAAKRWFIRGELDVRRWWMVEASQRVAARQWARWSAQVPVRRDRVLREWLWPSRYWQLAAVSLGLVGELFGASVVSPFMTEGFVAAVAQRMGPGGFVDRAAAIEGLLGRHLLPPEVARRRSKATFDGAFFAGPSRAFADRWDGEGLGNPHVVGHRLAVELRRSPRPDARSYALLKAAWLGGQNAP